MGKKKRLTSADRRKQRRAGLVKTFDYCFYNGLGTVPHEIECEGCGRRYEGGEQSWAKGRPCLCGHEYARYVHVPQRNV